MTNFIAVNEAQENALTEILEEHPLIPDADSFIKAYNTGLVNKSNDVITSIAEQISQTYKNVELKRSVLTFVSEEEMSLNDLTKYVQAWRFGLLLKNEVKLLEDEVLTDRVFLGDNDTLSPVLYHVDSAVNYANDDQEELNPITSKLLNTRDEPKWLLEILDLPYTQEDNGFVLAISDVLQLDGSILSSAVAAIENH